MKSLYLLVNFFTIIIPLIFSFHPKINFYKTSKAFFLGSFIVAVPFIIWDAIFTQIGVWNFNPRYLLGIYLFGLPLEEILFFFCIPFSCVFTYFCLDKFYDLRWNPKWESVFFLAFPLILIGIGTYHHGRIYTMVTMYTTALTCLCLKYVARVDWLGKATLVYGVLLLPFFIVNGILTGSWIDEAVVRYNAGDFMGLRMLTIPVEDAFYGLELILLNIYLYKLLQKRFSQTTTP